MKNTPARVLAGSRLTEGQTHHIFETNTLGISEPEAVARNIRALLRDYYGTTGQKSLDDILGFHHRFERIHPFQDSNRCVGRLLLFKECVCHHHVPFTIADALKTFYYRGLQQWPHIREYLRAPLPDSTVFLPSQTPTTQDSPLSHKPCGAPRRLTIHHHSSCCSDINHTTQPRCGISRTQKLVKATESSERAGACVGVESARREVTEHQTASSTAPSAPLEKISF